MSYQDPTYRILGYVQTYSAASSPGVNNDSADTAAIGREFMVGDMWTNTSSDMSYICVDSSVGAAVWVYTTVTAASQLTIAKLGTPVMDTVQEFMQYTGSAGTVEDGSITDAGGGTIDVAAGEGTIRPTDSCNAPLYAMTWAASSGISIPTDTVRYVGVEYNSGTPQVVVKSADTWDGHTEFRLGSVVNEGGTIHILNNAQVACDSPFHSYHRFYETRPFERAERLGGIIPGETGTRNLTLSAGEFYDGNSEFPIDAVDTSGADTCERYYVTSGTWTLQTSITQWDNTQYNNITTGLAAMTSNWWANIWLWVDPESNGKLIMLYPQAQFANLASAEDETPPNTLPLRLQKHGVFIGRIIFQKSAATAQEIESIYETTFGSTAVTDHNSLAGLQGGAAGGYYHLTAGEYTGLSGITTGSVLFADGAGNIGQDNANLFWDNSNNRLGIGTATPQTLFDFRQTAGGEIGRFYGSDTNGAIGFYSPTGNVNRGFFGFGGSGAIFSGAGTNSLAFRSEADLHFGAWGNNLALTLDSNNVFSEKLGGLSTNWVANSLSMGHDSSGHTSWIQSGAAAGTILYLNPQGAPVTIGAAASTHTLTGTGDLIVSGRLEVDGTCHFDGTANFYSNTYVNSNLLISSDAQIVFGSGPNSYLDWSTGQTNDGLVWGLGDSSQSIIFCQSADRATDFLAPNYTNPTIRIQSADATNVNQYLYLQHNQTNGVIAVGSGALVLPQIEAITSGGLSTGWIANSLSMGHDSSGHTSWIQSGAVAGTILYLNPQGGPVTIGAAASTHTLTGTGDLIVSGKLEVDGAAYFDADIYIKNGEYIYLGDTPSSGIAWDTNYQSNPAVVWGLGDTSKYMVICDYADRTKNFDKANQSNPTLFISSATDPDTNNMQYGALQHNQTDWKEIIGLGSKITEHITPVELADDASFSLPTASEGIGEVRVIGAETYARFSWESDGTVTISDSSADVTNADTDTYFCLFDGGTSVTVRNRLGAAKKVMFEYRYYTP